MKDLNAMPRKDAWKYISLGQSNIVSLLFIVLLCQCCVDPTICMPYLQCILTKKIILLLLSKVSIILEVDKEVPLLLYMLCDIIYKILKLLSSI